MKITGETLLKLGFEEGREIGLALTITNQLKEMPEDAILELLKNVLTQPQNFETHQIYGPLAQAIVEKAQVVQEIPLKTDPVPFEVYGKEGIEEGAFRQMETAVTLPVAIAGALMPDAHQGYGLPIGGVLATDNAIIPYAVGVDIGCRMCLSIYELPAQMTENNRDQLKKMLNLNSKFGRDKFKKPKDHEVLSNSLFKELPLVKGLKDKAYRQIGTSGGGNHFVEFGYVEITDVNNEWDILPGRYLALLSHSGSRGLGATIANHYTKLAMQECLLPKQAKHLAWLDLDTELGQEYWLAMNLAGDYASACHHQIHERMAVGLRTQPIAMVENHHNFAWKEKTDKGQEVIVHRKGATPAGKGVLGIIPGSMTAPGFIVRGKGNPLSLNSASHGAGRVMSRTAAKKKLDRKTVMQHLKAKGVEVIGSDLDEAPMAYKDIHQVMNFQNDLVDIVGTFQPKVVRMCGDSKFRGVD